MSLVLKLDFMFKSKQTFMTPLQHPFANLASILISDCLVHGKHNEIVEKNLF